MQRQLYERVGRGREFTDAGRGLAAMARKLLDNFERLDMELSDLRGQRSGTPRIAIVTTSKYFIPHLLGSFCKQYPGMDLQFKVGNRQPIIDRLQEGLDDLYVFSHPARH